MAARLFVELLDGLLQATVVQPVDVPALAADDGDKRTLASAHERHEWGDVQARTHLDEVGHALAQRERPPDVVEPRAEDGEAVGAVAIELLLEEGTEPLTVFAQTLLLLVRELWPAGRFRAVDLVEERVHPRRRVACGGGVARIQVEIEADRAAVLRPKPCEVPEAVPRHCRGHYVSLRRKAAILVIEVVSGGSFDRCESFNTAEEEMTEETRELIIIGGGPAGYTAALYAARANLQPLVIEGFAWGGQLMITSDVENYPGYPDGIMGPEMMQDFRRQAERFGAEFVTDDVTKVDFSEHPFRVWVGDTSTRAEAVIVATGASARQLGLESERSLQGRASPTARSATQRSSATRRSWSSAAATPRWRRRSS